MAKITDTQIRNVPAKSKQIADGSVTGLWFFPGSAKGKGKWILKFTCKATKARREMGLGVYPDVKIEEARKRALDAKELIAKFIDPIEKRKQDKISSLNLKKRITFEDAARARHKEKLPTWKNKKHADQWINSLRDYTFNQIGSKFVDELKVSDFKECLQGVWLNLPETGSRVKQRCYEIMAWCLAHEYTTANPIIGIEYILGRQPKISERLRHYPAMEWNKVPDFIKYHLKDGKDVTRVGLEFLILTAARSGEVRGAKWSEMDIQNKTWRIPKERMKGKKQHNVPLSEGAIKLLSLQKKLHPDSELVFPSPRGKILTDMAFTSFLRKHKILSSEPGVIATAHGFRSSFRDWCSHNGYARDLAEKSLAHEIGSKTEKAYHRTDLLEERRPLMNRWSNFVQGK